jgi:hypothetical protein
MRRPVLRASLPACFALGLVTLGCVNMPDPPPRPEDLSALAAQYDRPTAELPVERVLGLIEEGRRLADLGEVLNRLHFIRSAIGETNTGLALNTNSIDLVLQGSISATVPCPGDGPAPTADGNVNGVLRLRFGVENSFLRRGFEGTAESCRVRASLPLLPEQQVVVSADIVGDLGADLAIGDALPGEILLALGNVSGKAVSTVATIELARQSYNFRLTRDDALEILLDPASIGLPGLGSVVFAVRSDGSFALRERRGEWRCGGGGEMCVLR